GVPPAVLGVHTSPMSENEDRHGHHDSPAPPRRPPGYRPPQPPAADAADPLQGDHMPEGVPPAPPGPGDDAPAPGQPMPGPDAQLREGDRQYARAPEVSIRLPESLKSVTRSHWLALVLSQGAAYVTLLLV